MADLLPGTFQAYFVPLENSCLAFCDDGHASWYVTLFLTVRLTGSGSFILLPGSVNLSDLFMTAWNEYFIVVYSFIIAQESLA